MTTDNVRDFSRANRNPMRVVLYIRVSTASKMRRGDAVFYEQEPTVQEDPLRNLVEQRGWELSKVYSDRASGAEESRPGLNALMADAQCARFDALIVRNLRQITRCLTDLLEILDELDRLGIVLAAVEDGIDTSDPRTHDTVRGLVAALLHAEHTDRSERSSEALADTQVNGTRSGRPPGRPRREIDRARIRDLRAQGRSLSEIAAEFGVSISLVRRECAGIRADKEPPTMATKGAMQEIA